MKKIALLTITSFCIFPIANAQITKGSTFLGGSINVFSDKDETSIDEETEQSNWNIRPQIGKAIANNKILGLFLNFANYTYEQKYNNSNSVKNETSTTGGGVFYRSYYPLGQRFFLFGDASLGLNFTDEIRTNKNGTVSYDSFKNDITEGILSLTPGISFAATKKLYLEAAFSNLLVLSYQSSKGTEYSSPNTVLKTTQGTQFSANANASGFNYFAVGFRWILPANK